MGNPDDMNKPPGALCDSTANAMERYFSDLDGQTSTDLYAIVMAEVEPPLLSAVMKYNRHNQSKACLLYTSPSPRDGLLSRMPSSA